VSYIEVVDDNTGFAFGHPVPHLSQRYQSFSLYTDILHILQLLFTILKSGTISTNFNEDSTHENTSVASSNVRL